MKSWNLDGLYHHAKSQREITQKSAGYRSPPPAHQPAISPCAVCGKLKDQQWHIIMEGHDYVPSPTRAARTEPRFYATYRICTGTAEGLGEIIDRDTGRCIWSCAQAHHRHPYIARPQGSKIRSAAARAQECAKRQLRKMLRTGQLPSDVINRAVLPPGAQG